MTKQRLEESEKARLAQDEQVKCAQQAIESGIVFRKVQEDFESERTQRVQLEAALDGTRSELTNAQRQVRFGVHFATPVPRHSCARGRTYIRAVLHDSLRLSFALRIGTATARSWRQTYAHHIQTARKDSSHVNVYSVLLRRA